MSDLISHKNDRYFRPSFGVPAALGRLASRKFISMSSCTRKEEKAGASLTKVRDVSQLEVFKMRRSSILLALCLGLVAGCSQRSVSSLPPSEAQSGTTTSSLRLGPSLTRQLRTALSFKSLYDFAVAPDGANPFGSLLSVNGTLYGTTLNGGENHIGTVYKVSKSGKERVLYNFADTPDGKYPIAGLVALNGTFYGTTGYGGTAGNGTIFKVSTSGAEHVLYSFSAMPDGNIPQASLVDMNGTLYGTTQYGGGNDLGTIFKVSTSGAEHVLYSFAFTGSDGRYPVAGLVDVNGALYGTTQYGGASGNGTIFKVNTSGAEHVVYSFSGTPDGANPYAGLLALNGTLYGTTQYGGANGNGTVFKVSTSGAEHVLYSFKGTPDGANPYGGLEVLNGTLYGTTYSGGNSGNGGVFKVSTSGVEKVIYSFTGLPYGGRYPAGSLIAVKGALYGTTSEGGTSMAGTVFKLTP